MKKSIVLGILLLGTRLWGQLDSAVTRDLSFYGDVMVNASSPMHRQYAADMFLTKIKSCIAEAPAIGYLRTLPWITVIAPVDSSFSIVTWEVEEETQYRYFGYIVFPAASKRPPIELVDTRPLNSEYATHTPEQWYGALYYGIEPFKRSDGRNAYVLLGFNAYTPRLNQRVADVLVLNDREATLGLPVFWSDSTGTELKSRLIIEYADAAAGTLRFDREKHMIIYDNVIPIDTPEGTTMAPDGSYHGYVCRNGVWQFIDKVFHETQDTPPGGRPKEQTPRDLFGRPIKNGGH